MAKKHLDKNRKRKNGSSLFYVELKPWHKYLLLEIPKGHNLTNTSGAIASFVLGGDKVN